GISVAQTTTADPDGLYTLGYLEPGEYNLVVVLDGYMIAVEAGVTVEAGVENGGHNFILTALDQGDAFHTISGEVLNVPDVSANPRVKAVTQVDSTDVVADHSLVGTDVPS
ncbi:MAG: carboxypeptidase regulatory-like domain-containing protein, partial [Deltaproteobacteria bacterium]|nr:carboxypeptidase regulatory-like domain-containing protein [Deltaproteobacteria bacterium]